MHQNDNCIETNMSKPKLGSYDSAWYTDDNECYHFCCNISDIYEKAVILLSAVKTLDKLKYLAEWDIHMKAPLLHQT